MELGEKLKQARLEAGLSQRQLCGDVITRNMLSQIENGSAKPSMATLRYLADRLGKSVSYFLEENAVLSPNQSVMVSIRKAYAAKELDTMGEALARYQWPDPVFDGEYSLLRRLYFLETAEKVMDEKRERMAAQLLEELGPITDGYCRDALERRRLLLLAQLLPKSRGELLRNLPSLDAELMIRGRNALELGDLSRAEHLLESVENREAVHWHFLRGQVYQARKQYAEAVACYMKAEDLAAARLELCYRELGNYERAYYYACKQREM